MANGRYYAYFPFAFFVRGAIDPLSRLSLKSRWSINKHVTPRRGTHDVLTTIGSDVAMVLTVLMVLILECPQAQLFTLH